MEEGNSVLNGDSSVVVTVGEAACPACASYHTRDRVESSARLDGDVRSVCGVLINVVSSGASYDTADVVYVAGSGLVGDRSLHLRVLYLAASLNASRDTAHYDVASALRAYLLILAVEASALSLDHGIVACGNVVCYKTEAVAHKTADTVGSGHASVVGAGDAVGITAVSEGNGGVGKSYDTAYVVTADSALVDTGVKSDRVVDSSEDTARVGSAYLIRVCGVGDVQGRGSRGGGEAEHTACRGITDDLALVDEVVNGDVTESVVVRVIVTESAARAVTADLTVVLTVGYSEIYLYRSR